MAKSKEKEKGLGTCYICKRRVAKSRLVEILGQTVCHPELGLGEHKGVRREMKNAEKAK